MNLLHAHHDAFTARGRAAEEAYFRTKDAELVDKLARIFHAKLDRDELREASGITNEEVLDRLIRANLRGELLTAFRLYPLVEMAWADGRCDDHEARAVVNAAIELGVDPDSESIHRLDYWLRYGPTEDGRRAWRMFAAELRDSLTPEELATFRTDLLNHARVIAEASGGFLWKLFQVSVPEHRVLEEIRAALTHA